MSLDELAAAGLYDPGAPDAAERREYLEYLLERFSVDDILGVHVQDLDHPVTDILAVLNGPRHTYFTAVEVADRVGMTPHEVENLRALVGLPVRDLHSREIAETFLDDVALYQFGVAAYGEERTLAFARVFGALVAALMEAGRELTWASTADTPMSELEVAIANDAATQASRALPQMFEHLFFERAARDIWFEEELRRRAVTMAVAFVDLVGSTNWTAALHTEAHAAALNRFEAAAVRAAGRHSCRVIKFIGDEAMIVGRDAAAVAAAAAELRVTIVEDDVLPGARGTVGYGRVTPRGGDYFGDTVNLVARATKEVGGDALVVTPDVAAQLDPSEWIIGAARAVTLRGVAAPFEIVEVERKGR